MARHLLSTAAVAALTTTVLAGAAAAQEDCGEVTITEMDWASASIVTNVATFLMEQGYGCEVSVLPSSTNSALVSVAETGEPDIVTEVWPNGNPSYDTLSEAGTIETVSDVLSDGSVQGWYVPTYLVEEHPELATLQGLLDNPDLVGNRLHSCPEGWACNYSTMSLAEAVEIEDAGIEVFEHGSGETLATSMAAAYENQEPWLGYYWEPTAILGKYDMTLVDLGPYEADIFECNQDPDCNEVGVTGYPNTPVLTVVTTTFGEEHPELSELLSNLSFTNAQMGEVLAWQEENAASPEEGAVYFLTNYSDVWKDWVNEDARANLAAIIE